MDDGGVTYTVDWNGKRLAVDRRVLVSFDVRALQEAGKAAVYRLIFRRRAKVNGKTYRYEGLLHQGATRLGQSVFLCSEEQASALVDVLRRHKVSFLEKDLFVTP